VLLVPYQIGFREPPAEVRVDVAQARDSKCMHVISRRKRLDSAKARMVETSGKNHMPIQPSATWSDLRERHTHLKGDTSLLGQNSHGPNRSNGCNHLLIENPNRRWLAAEVVGQREAAAGVRLIPIGERASAILTSPQAWSVGHWNVESAPASRV
jgi:hypothetical protein